MKKRVLFLLIIMVSFFVLSSSASAYIAPYYSYGEVWTKDWVLDPGSGSVYWFVNKSDSFEGSGEGYIYEGNRFWTWGTVSMENGAYGQGTQMYVNPVTGVMEGHTGTFGYNAITGSAVASGYMSQVFQVTSDGSLNPGDPINVQAHLQLDGSFSGPAYSNVQAIVFLNKIDDSNQNMYYNWYDYLDFSTADNDIRFDLNMMDAMLGSIVSKHFYGPTSDDFPPVDETIYGDVAVGDLVLIETMLWIETNAVSTDDIEYSEADFSHTLSSLLSTQTPGAVLTPYVVPVPSSILLLLTGIILLFRISINKR